VPVYAVTFSPDSQQLAAGSFNNVARLWNLHKREAAPIVLRGHDGPVFTVAFSPDGQRLATGSYDQTIRLWQARTADLADQVCERVWRNLTLAEWRQFIGADLPYERTCPNLSLHPSVLAESEKLTRAGDVDGAVAFLQRIRERDPAVEINPHKQVAQALVTQGKALEKAGNPDGAHALFEQARMLDPTVGLHSGAKTPQ
jgi:WD40 repeat protein